MYLWRHQHCQGHYMGRFTTISYYIDTVLTKLLEISHETKTIYHRLQHIGVVPLKWSWVGSSYKFPCTRIKLFFKILHPWNSYFCPWIKIKITLPDHPPSYFQKALHHFKSNNNDQLTLTLTLTITTTTKHNVYHIHNFFTCSIPNMTHYNTGQQKPWNMWLKCSPLSSWDLWFNYSHKCSVDYRHSCSCYHIFTFQNSILKLDVTATTIPLNSECHRLHTCTDKRW